MTTTLITNLFKCKSIFGCCKRLMHINNAACSSNSDSKESVVPNDLHAQEQISDELFGDLEERKKARIDPDETSALLFPGQGSQYVGMAKQFLKYPNVKDMFDSASEILNLNLLTLCLEGPKSELDRTINCQPAVVVTALAGVEKLQAENPEVLENCFMAAGYSVGEYAALVFARSLSFEDAIRLVKVRAEEMQKASDDVGGGMISAIGGAKTKFNLACLEAVEYCHDTLKMDGVVCKVAGHLAPNVRTIAGHRAALEYLVSQKQKYFINRVQILPVSGGFHSPLMYPAVGKVKTLLKAMEVHTPIIHVYSNVDGKPYRGAKDIINKLPSQIIQPVRWEQTIHALYARSSKHQMPHSYELGPGRQLGALLRRCNGKAWLKYEAVDSEGQIYG